MSPDNTPTQPSLSTSGPVPATLSRLWENGILTHLSVSQFRAKGRLLPDDVTADPERLTPIVKLGTKELFEEEMLRPIKQADTKARNAFLRSSLPFPVGSARFVPFKAWPGLESQLKGAKIDFDAAVEEFLANYEANRDAMLAKYPAQLRADDYPNKGTLRYSMDWTTFTLAPSNEMMAEKVRNAVDDFVRDTVATLRERVAETCAEQADRLGSGKAVSERSMNALRTMVQQFESLNFVGDKTTEAAIAQLREQLGLRTAKEVRESDVARADLKRVLDLVTESVTKAENPEVAAAGFLGRAVQLDVIEAPAPGDIEEPDVPVPGPEPASEPTPEPQPEEEETATPPAEEDAPVIKRVNAL